MAALPAIVETVQRKILEHITEQCLVCCDVGVPCNARQACDDTSSLIFPFQVSIQVTLAMNLSHIFSYSQFWVFDHDIKALDSLFFVFKVHLQISSMSGLRYHSDTVESYIYIELNAQQEDEVAKCRSCGSVFHKRCFSRLSNCHCGAQLKPNKSSAELQVSEKKSDSMSVLPLRFLTGLFGKTEKDKETTILMGSLPTNDLQVRFFCVCVCCEKLAFCNVSLRLTNCTCLNPFSFKIQLNTVQ